MVKGLTRLILTLLFFQTTISSWSQSSSPLNNSEFYFNQGVELIDKANFSAARSNFEKYLNQNTNEFLNADAEYYIAFCAINLFQDDAEKLYDNFIKKHPTHPSAESAYLELANFYYRGKNYQKANEYYQKVNFSRLTTSRWQEANFHAGYSNFATRNFAEALPYFNAIKRQSGKYSAASNYYAGYAEFQVEDFTSAVEDLERAEKEPAYKIQVPHMLISSYYKLARYEKAISYGEKVLEENDRLAQSSEIYLVTGDSHFALKQYPEASEYYELYQELAGSQASPVIQFKIGFAHLSAGKDQMAEEALKKVAIQNDDAGYLASYYLGTIYAKQKNFEFAITSFEKSKRYSEDKTIAEESLFNLAKINFESDKPGQAVTHFNEFLKTYPNSNHKREANELLSRSLLNSSNYDLAILHIETLPSIGSEVARVYQKATFLKGVELFNKRNFPAAVEYWSKSLKHPFDNELVVDAHLWKGEAYSIGRRFDEAIESYLTVLGNRSVGESTILKARYGIGYAYFNTKDYDRALVHFREYVRAGSGLVNSSNFQDAQLRLADCYYVAKSYSEALTYYRRISESGPEKAYAFLQIGIIQSLQNNMPAAKASFEKVINEYSRSRYLDDAMFERAQIDFERGFNQEAIVWFDKLVNNNPQSKFTPFAIQRRAIANYNLKEYNKTIEDYVFFLKEHPGHKEVNNVLLGLQDALAIQNRTSEFQNYLDEFKDNNPTQKGLEAVEYQAAKNLYFAQDYERAIPGFKAFIDNYPDDINVIEARYYLAESYYRSEKNEDALKIYSELLNDRTFSEISRVIQRIAEIEQKEKRLENAMHFYHQLLTVASNKRQQYVAWSGLMESHFAAYNYDSVQYYAQTILDRGAASPDGINKATLYQGKASYSMGDFERAKDSFINTLNTAKDEYGAEAQYLLAEILHLEEQFKQSNEALFDLHKTFSSYQLWYDKSFLLIADNFVKMSETFQATQTLQSLIDNSTLSFIVDQAKLKLAAITRTPQLDSIKTDTTRERREGKNE
jgi:tetratricopeptide (TPR) repeat protein